MQKFHKRYELDQDLQICEFHRYSAHSVFCQYPTSCVDLLTGKLTEDKLTFAHWAHGYISEPYSIIIKTSLHFALLILQSLLGAGNLETLFLHIPSSYTLCLHLHIANTINRISVYTHDPNRVGPAQRAYEYLVNMRNQLECVFYSRASAIGLMVRVLRQFILATKNHYTPIANITAQQNRQYTQWSVENLLTHTDRCTYSLTHTQCAYFIL